MLLVYIFNKFQMCPTHDVSICKTRAFRLTVLALVWSQPGNNCMSDPFCRIHIYGMYVQATALVSPGALLFLVFIFEPSLVKFKTVPVASLLYL